METTITKSTPVEYEFEIHATADDIKPRLNKALRQQSNNMDMKGFRQGKVPLGMVKKMYGEAIGYQVAEEYVQDVFEDTMEENDEVDPLGQPLLTELDYEVDGDLHAVIRFGVEPEVELKDLSDEELPVLTHTVTEEDVEDEIEKMRTEEADLMPVDDEAADEGDWVSVDLQRIDPSTDTPLIGDKEEDLSFFLDDERLKKELREALLGKAVGATFRVRLPQDAPPEQGGSGEEDEERLYEVTLNDVKRRDLPPVDAEFVRRITEGELEDPETFREEMHTRLQEAYDDQSREMVQGEIIDKMLDLHGVPVPDSVTEKYLDSFVQQVREENDGDLPDDFDEDAFRQRNRSDAEKQGRWMLIRDAVIDEHDIGVTDEELIDYLNENASNPEQTITESELRQYRATMPQMMERVKQQILSEKVYDTLLEQFDTQEKTREEFQDLMEERHRRRQELAGGPAGGSGHGQHAHAGHSH
jgi:trigger factor